MPPQTPPNILSEDLVNRLYIAQKVLLLQKYTKTAVSPNVWDRTTVFVTNGKEILRIIYIEEWEASGFKYLAYIIVKQ